MRQFGYEQPIPLPCFTSESLHRIDRRGVKNKSYERIHAKYLEEWNKREDRVVSGTLPRGQTSSASLHAYLSWYRTISRLIITPPNRERPSTQYQPASNEFVLSEAIAEMARKCTRAIETTSDLPDDKALELALHTLKSLANSCTETLYAVDKAYMLHDLGLATQSTSSSSILDPRPSRHIPNYPRPPISPTPTPTPPRSLTPHPPCPPRSLTPPPSQYYAHASPRSYTTTLHPPSSPLSFPSPSSLPLNNECSSLLGLSPLPPLTYQRRPRTSTSFVLESITKVDESALGSSAHQSKKRRTS